MTQESVQSQKAPKCADTEFKDGTLSRSGRKQKPTGFGTLRSWVTTLLTRCCATDGTKKTKRGCVNVFKCSEGKNGNRAKDRERHIRRTKVQLKTTKKKRRGKKKTRKFGKMGKVSKSEKERRKENGQKMQRNDQVERVKQDEHEQPMEEGKMTDSTQANEIEMEEETAQLENDDSQLEEMRALVGGQSEDTASQVATSPRKIIWMQKSELRSLTDKEAADKPAAESGLTLLMPNVEVTAGGSLHDNTRVKTAENVFSSRKGTTQNNNLDQDTINGCQKGQNERVEEKVQNTQSSTSSFQMADPPRDSQTDKRSQTHTTKLAEERRTNDRKEEEEDVDAEISFHAVHNSTVVE